MANDLLRLGNDEEGWKLADEVYQQDRYNVVAYNLVTLGNTIANYSVLEREGFIVRMEPEEARIYGEMVLDLLVEAKSELCDKYGFRVEVPIFVEIFPRQQDFAIRTFGLPGGAGYLGVCFGRVITMNSPLSQVRTGSNWQSVLWHEFCHVVTLQKTGNKMPRWLSEGISVYEERQKDRSWGQVMTPAYREMILADQMTPVSQLSSAFVKPESGEALQFAYYQSSLVVDYLVETYGLETLQSILDDLNIGMPINESLGRYAGDVQLLDREFTVYARKRAEELAVDADWTRPELTASASIEDWQAWNANHVNNVFGLRAEAALLIEQGKLDAAEQLLQQFIKVFPDYRGANDPYQLLAAIARARGDEDQEYALLKEAAQRQSAAIDVYSRLVELATAKQDWQEVSQQAHRWLAINPLVPAPHRAFAAAAEQRGDFPGALRSLQALTFMDPFDPAEAYYRYARALHACGQDGLAKRQVLKCLEEAPRYRAAHQLLLRLSGEKPSTDAADASADASPDAAATAKEAAGNGDAGREIPTDKQKEGP